MKIKQFAVLLLVIAMCTGLVSCAGNNIPGTSTDESTTETTTSATETDTEQTTESAKPEQTTTEKPEEPEPPKVELLDTEYLKIGNHVTVVYNAAACDVEFQVKQGVGSKQQVTLTAKMKDGFLFDGWSAGNALVNNTAKKPVHAASENLTYSFEASSATTIYLNTSMTVIYHANEGIVKGGGTTYSDTFSLVFYKNPNTLPEKGYFTRTGYTLTEYNTEADGTGISVSLGGRIDAGGKPTLDLYCIWEQNTPESDFRYDVKNGKAIITGYAGDAETIVIPEKLGGSEVSTIASYAIFQNKTVKKIVVAKTVNTIEDYGIDSCPALETVILFDASFGKGRGISDNGIDNCMNFKNLRINTVYELYDAWQSYGANKFDRLLWAKDIKKIIIIGGSGTFYGYDGAALERALGGEYEIINFGENANISSLIYFDIVEDFVKEGDIVLWSPEPGPNTLGSTKVGGRFWDFRKSDYDFLKYVDFSIYDDLFSSFSRFCGTLRTSSFKPFDALTASTDKYGGDTSNRSWNGNQFNYSFNYEFGAEETLKALVASITEKGASVYFSFAAMQKSGIERVDESVVAQYEAMITSIPGIVSISAFESCIYQDNYFWESPWHMTVPGAKMRTESVGRDILAQLEKEGK